MSSKCIECNRVKLKNSSYCEKHFFDYKSKKHVGTRTKGWELKKILENQNYQCIYTGVELIPGVNATVDHIVAVSKWFEGRYRIDNLQWVCWEVNMMKYFFDEEDFLEWVRLIHEKKSK